MLLFSLLFTILTFNLVDGITFAALNLSQSDAFNTTRVYSSFGQVSPTAILPFLSRVVDNISWRSFCQLMAAAKNLSLIVYWIDGTEMSCGIMGLSMEPNITYYSFEEHQIVRVEENIN